MQFGVIGWNEELKEFLNNAIECYAKTMRGKVEQEGEKKVKFGDMTVKQLHDICLHQDDCPNCPIRYSYVCMAFSRPQMYDTDKAIDLPDEEVKEDDEG